MSSIEYAVCVVELYPTIMVSSGVAFCVGILVGFVMHSVMTK